MAPIKQRTVGVVDDDPNLRRAVQRLLTAYGCVVKLYGSGEEFFLDPGRGELSCIIVDINLGGMTGIELRQQLTASGSTVPVIFMTAFDSPHVKQLARNTGCVSYLLKPFSASLLFEAIEKANG